MNFQLVNTVHITNYISFSVDNEGLKYIYNENHWFQLLFLRNFFFGLLYFCIRIMFLLLYKFPALLKKATDRWSLFKRQLPLKSKKLHQLRSFKGRVCTEIASERNKFSMAIKHKSLVIRYIPFLGATWDLL